MPDLPLDPATLIPLGREGRRAWAYQEVRVGYRLWFRDDGQQVWTNAGVHRSIMAMEHTATQEFMAPGQRKRKP